MAINYAKTYPTQFTLPQLERLRALASTELSRQPDPETHNLARKLSEYCEIMRSHEGVRIGSADRAVAY